ncbi:tenomodulin isoform X2 [Trichomycterus rosablanca]|uniref:tenomodulin isoform X2 n=1 Tax=Trichomycterus rosablanca TaxID=2290929 RepID=UPI002F35ED44
MENEIHSSSQQALCKDAELGRKTPDKKNARYKNYQCVALILCLLFLMLTICIFSLGYIWNPSPAKMYSHEFKAVLDGVETDSLMEINPAKRMEMIRVGNSTDEVVEVHDFQNVGEPGDVDMQVVDSYVWIPTEQPISNLAFLQNSKIWEICRELPIHWMYQSTLKEFHDAEDLEILDPLETQTHAVRKARDVPDELPVNDYSEAGLQLDTSLDEQGYCCHYCRRGYRFCRRYHMPMLGYWQYPYWHQDVVCRIVMPCNWWIARMLGRV